MSDESPFAPVDTASRRRRIGVVVASLTIVTLLVIVLGAGLRVVIDNRPHNCYGYSTDAYCPGAKNGLPQSQDRR